MDCVVFQDCSHVSKTKEEFYSVRCTVADMKNLYVSQTYFDILVYVSQEFQGGEEFCLKP